MIIYLIDIDGTMFSNHQREHLIPENKDCSIAWQPFNQAHVDDKPRHLIIDLVKTLIDSGKTVKFCTSRSKPSRETTLIQLHKYLGSSNYSLIMRDLGDNRSYVEYKREVIRRLSDHQIIAIDDDPKVCQMMRDEGVTVLQVDSQCVSVTCI